MKLMLFFKCIHCNFLFYSLRLIMQIYSLYFINYIYIKRKQIIYYNILII